MRTLYDVACSLGVRGGYIEALSEESVEHVALSQVRLVQASGFRVHCSGFGVRV
jgi:hypothetical protein